MLLVLDGVEMDTLAMLMEYIYTGQCIVRERAEVDRMIELKNMLNLNISLDLPKDHREPEDPPPSPPLESGGCDWYQEPEAVPSQKKSENIELKKLQRDQLPSDMHYDNPDNETKDPDKVLEEKAFPTHDTEYETTNDSKASIAKLKEAACESHNSMLAKVVGSIRSLNKVESIQIESSSNSFDTIREEIYGEIKDIENNTEGAIPLTRQKFDSDNKVPSKPTESDDIDDAIPSMPTEMLIEELDNEEKRLSLDVLTFIDGIGDQEISCTECGEKLLKDNFVEHYKAHVEGIQEAKAKLTPRNDQIHTPRHLDLKQQTVEVTDNSIFPTPPQIDDTQNRINKLQEDQERISKDIVGFMALFQQGIPQLRCTECQEVLTHATLVEHFKKHITDLNAEIEVLARAKNKIKRKHEVIPKDNPKRRIKSIEETPTSLISSDKCKQEPASQSSDTFSRFLDSICPKMGINSKDTNTTREDERKKIYKRIYGRKKYQYKINNCNEDVKVSEEEIDAEIARSKAKYAGNPTAALDKMIGSSNTENLTPGQVLQTFVQPGSKEYKHEFKKARDRLYKRKLRVMRINGESGTMDIPRPDIELEMLTRYTSNKIKVESLDTTNPFPTSGLPAPPPSPPQEHNQDWYEMQVGQQQWNNDPMMGEFMQMEFHNGANVELGTGITLDMLPDNYFMPGTLEEGVDDMMAF